jgi:hypothetical protein
MAATVLARHPVDYRLATITICDDPIARVALPAVVALTVPAA